MRRPQIALLGLATIAFLPSPEVAEASCAAPTLQVVGADGSPVVLHRGDRVTVLGRGFVAGCDDTGHVKSGVGCAAGNDDEEDLPLRDVELVILRGQPTMTQTSLGVADAGTAAGGRLGEVRWTVVVPSRQHLGRAVLKTEGSEPLRVRIVR